MEMNINQMHAVVKAFVGLGAPTQYDDQGPNKMDWHFFTAHAGRVALKQEPLPPIANRLWKYRNTQMPRVFAQVGLPSDSPSVLAMLTDTKEMEELPQVTFSRINDSYTNRWGKTVTQERTAVHFPYIKAAPLHVPLKQALEFPALKFNGDTKTWSIDNTKQSYDTAVAVLTAAGAEVIPLERRVLRQAEAQGRTRQGSHGHPQGHGPAPRLALP